ASQKAVHLWSLFRDSLVSCQFVPWRINQQAEIVSAVTGWNYTVYEALKLGERVAALGRIYNLREGITSAQDSLPKRMFGPTKKGGLAKGGIDPAKMQRAINSFYEMMGWDGATGVPLRSKLGELQIGWAAEEIPAAKATASAGRTRR
ncbi:MAG: aldehyde ferredoxin oxidoreductase C-terminal domain-containing protein, partial [Chloroflexota bacterium]|nr:aldehyde ferredoxin oxidoreductase C-terminal domain-containing protein [Chloroflexota bacterium]